MNCFRNLYIFAAETTVRIISLQLCQLWIAFEICIYLQLKQLVIGISRLISSCELLSKFVYICSWNNSWIQMYETASVVNCFRNLYIFAAETTDDKIGYNCISLWIAFEICIYLQLKQLPDLYSVGSTSCELLSKFVYICSWNNRIGYLKNRHHVVNCFRNLYIFAAETTSNPNFMRCSKLWIAFEICIYLQLKQP